LGLGELPLLLPLSPSSFSLLTIFLPTSNYRRSTRIPLVVQGSPTPHQLLLWPRFPPELLDIIVDKLSTQDRLRLCAVSFGLLARISPGLFSSSKLVMGYGHLSRFIAGRVRRSSNPPCLARRVLIHLFPLRQSLRSSTAPSQTTESDPSSSLDDSPSKDAI